MSQILLFSDLVAPLWMVIIMGYLMDRGLTAWKAWVIASTFCVVLAYVVAKLIGWNIGGYVIIFIAAIPPIYQASHTIQTMISITGIGFCRLLCWLPFLLC